MTAVTILAEATMRAAVRMALMKGLNPDPGELAEGLKRTVKANLGRVMEEWKQGLEANLNEAWLRELVNTQANELGLMTLKEMGLL